MDQLFIGQIMMHGNRMQRQPQPHADKWYSAKRTHDFDTYYISSWEDYLRMVTVVCFKDNTKSEKNRLRYRRYNKE